MHSERQLLQLKAFNTGEPAAQTALHGLGRAPERRPRWRAAHDAANMELAVQPCPGSPTFLQGSAPLGGMSDADSRTG
jgi:hypothetical protein